MEPRPQGDPSAVQAVSAQLAHYAARLEELAAGIPTILPSPVFIGPARAEHDSEFDHATAQAKAAAHTLELEARQLAREASELARRQHEWDRRKHAEDERKRQEAARQCNTEPAPGGRGGAW